MKISFACPQCAKPLAADASLAGRAGRCRHCGQRIVVPGAPAQAAGGTGSRGKARAGAPAPAADWRPAVARQLAPAAGRGTKSAGSGDAGPPADTTSGYSLRPVTPTRVPKLAAAEWDDAELGPAITTPLPSAFTAQVPAAAAGGAAFSPRGTSSLPQLPSSAVAAYRMFFGLLGRCTTWISATSYTISLLLIILAVASGMTGRHTVASWTMAAIIALNVVGLAGDLASLVTLSFRKDPLRGALFLVPPFTFFFLWSDWRRYRDTVNRMRIPLVTLAAVLAAYTFVPWLRGGKGASGPFHDTVERVSDTVDRNLGGVRSAVKEGLDTARPWLRELPVPASLPTPTGGDPPGATSAP